MIDERYCEPCKRLFSGKVQPHDGSTTHFTHHADADSLKRALDLPCAICSLAWSGKSASPSWRESISCPTECWLITGGEYENTIRFYHDDPKRYAKDIAVIPHDDTIGLKIQDVFSENTRSMAALNFLVEKYQECSEKHVRCGLPQSSTAAYPSRLIDVGMLEDSSVYLRDMQDRSKHNPYTCLSYCWGQDQLLKLTKKSESTLKKGVLISALPKTFQDAIFVTRLLGIGLLWIDSLCIFQDDEADWSIEASHMGDIYSRAACTIAATAAKDSNGGLFAERNPILLRSRLVEATWSHIPDSISYPRAGLYYYDIRHLWTEAIEKAPLNSRAWVCQERHLSPRVMHFSDTQLFWECYEHHVCEQYPGRIPEFAAPSWHDDISILRRRLHGLRQHRTETSVKDSNGDENLSISDSKILSESLIYFSWAAFRIRYSQCALTKDEDKLVAIQGIARQFGQILGDELIAGLWKSRLVEELCWFTFRLEHDKPPKPVKWRAPTWSWASSNERIWVSNTTKFHRECRQRQFWSELENVDVKAEASGELRHASLRILCKPIRAQIRDCSDGDKYYKASGVLMFEDSDAYISVGGLEPFDIEMDSLEKEQICSVHMIVIQRCPHEDHEDSATVTDSIEGLLLIPQHGSTDSFERVGLFRAHSSANVAIVLKEYEAAESKTITLV